MNFSHKPLFYLSSILLLFLALSPVFAQEYSQKPAAKARVMFLLDASGSMMAPLEGTDRMTVAKRLLSQLVDSLKSEPNVELALRVYGHQYPSRMQNCKDSKLEAGFAPNNHDLIIGKIKQIQPQGNTPIAYSLEQAGNDFKVDPQYRNILILITDGIESCDGDPCAVSKSLQRKGIFLKPFVIGLGMDAGFAENFSCVGRYFDASNIQDFKKALNTSIEQSLKPATASVELLDQQGKPTETNVNVTFINNATGLPVYDFVHYRDRNGKPDSVYLDPVISYDVVVNTIPSVTLKNVELKAGAHTVIQVKSPQGKLQITQGGASEYSKSIEVLVKDPRTGKTIHTQLVNEIHRYLSGTYDLEILTLPRITMQGVKIDPAKVNKIEIPSPGLLNLSSATSGFGSIYRVEADGTHTWVYNLPEERSRVTLAIQPGNYKLVFRAKNALGSKFTDIQYISIKQGSTYNIKFLGR